MTTHDEVKKRSSWACVEVSAEAPHLGTEALGVKEEETKQKEACRGSCRREDLGTEAL